MSRDGWKSPNKLTNVELYNYFLEGNTDKMDAPERDRYVKEALLRLLPTLFTNLEK